MIDFAFRIVLAYGFYAYSVFFLGLTGHCSRPWILTLSLLFLPPLIWFLRPAWPSRGKTPFHLPSLGLFIVLGILFAHAFLIPPFVRDDMIYHLLVPKQMALTGKLVFDPFNLNSNFPLLFEMPLAALETLRLPIFPFLFNVGFGLLLLMVFHAGLALHAKWAVLPLLAATAALGTTPVFFDLLHTCYVEIFFALLITLAAFFYFRHMDARDSRINWLQTCACLGLAAATKYPGWIFALIFFAFEFFRARDRKTFYAGLLLTAAIASPWYIKNWIWTGNPVFPFLNSLFNSPWVSPARFEGFHRMLADYNMGRGFLDTVLLPFRLGLGIDTHGPPPGPLGFDGKLSLLFLIALFGLGWKEKFRLFASLLFTAYFAIWALESQQVRLLLPVLPLAAIFGLKRMGDLPRTARWMLPALAVICMHNVWNIAGNFNRDKISPLLTGKMDRETFLAAQMPVSYGWAGEINRLLDPNRDKLMTVGSFGRNYYFDVPVLTNTYYDQEIFRKHFDRGRLEPDSVTAFLRDNGVTHILMNWDFVRRMHEGDTAFQIDSLNDYLIQKFAVTRQIDSYALLVKKGME